MCPLQIQRFCTTECMHWRCDLCIYNLVVPLSLYIGGVSTACTTLYQWAYTSNACQLHTQPYCTIEHIHWKHVHIMYILIVQLSIYIRRNIHCMYNLIVPLSVYVGDVPTALQPYCTTEFIHWTFTHSMYNACCTTGLYIGGMPTSCTTLLYH